VLGPVLGTTVAGMLMTHIQGVFVSKKTSVPLGILGLNRVVCGPSYPTLSSWLRDLAQLCCMALGKPLYLCTSHL
jgi:hypothetical protein